MNDEVRVVVCVPFRGGDEQREANWATVRAYYESSGLPLIVADSDESKPFNLSQARNRAVAMAEPWDIVVVSDADSMLSSEGLQNALDTAHQTGALVNAARRYWRTDASGNMPDEPSLNEGGGVFVWGRAAWNVLGGWDERFMGWNDEDFAAIWAAETLGLYREVDGDVVHLWHEYSTEWATGTEGWVDVTKEFNLQDFPQGQERLTDPLAVRYMRARGNPAAMRALLCERGAATITTPL